MRRSYYFLLLILFFLLLVLYALFNQQRQVIQASPTPQATQTTTQTPIPTETIEATSSGQEKNITIDSPVPHTKVGRTFIVMGRARVFENQFSIDVKNARTNKELFTKSVQSDAKDSGLFGNYSVTVTIPKTADVKNTDIIEVEAFQFSPKDGSKVDSVTVPLTFSE